MSIFRTQGIVLESKKSLDGERFYKIFFLDYGTLLVSKKKQTQERPLDIWYLINCEISTKTGRDIHTIWAVKILREFRCQEKSSWEIMHFLGLIATLSQDIMIGSPQKNIFDLVSQFLSHSDNHSLPYIILIHLKIHMLLWNIWDSHENIHVQKILKFIYQEKKCETLLRLWNIPQESLEVLKRLCLRNLWETKIF